MALSDKKLEDQLTEAGNSLIEPPASVEDLLRILAQVEDILSSVEQSPSKMMKKAMSPSLKALVSDKLFSHSSADVRVAVASCLSEIMRITAPEAPYDDDQMKVIFELIVSTFENLADKSSYSYTKRISILQTTAKVQSCVVMLDLECDGLIIEMFQHFLKAIRDYHPDTVISDMETIMTLVLDESEEISPEMLSPILASLIKDNGEVLALSKKLAEKVLQNCAAKVKPSLLEAVKSSGISFDDYSSVVASICEKASGGENLVGVIDGHLMDKTVPKQTAEEAGSVKDDQMGKTVPKQTAQEAGSVKGGQMGKTVQKRTAREAGSVKGARMGKTGPKQAAQEAGSVKGDQMGKTVPKQTAQEAGSVKGDKMGKAVPKQTAQEAGSVMGDQMGKTDPKQTAGEAGSVKGDVKDDPIADLLPTKIRSHADVIVQCRNIDRSVKANSDGLCDEQIKLTKTSLVDGDKEAETPKETENCDQLLPIPPPEIPSVKPVTSSENGKDTNIQKKTNNLVNEVKLSADNVSEHASEGATKTSIAPDSKNKNKGTNSTSSLKKKPNKQSGKEVDEDNDDGEESLKQMLDKEKLLRRKAASEKKASKTSAEDGKKTVSSQKVSSKSSKYEHGSDETPKTSSKRKRKPATEDVSDTEDSGKNLIGSRIKVWWPLDRAFYDGVIDSYDSEKKKYLVLYDDGEQETLDLKREKWEVMDSEPKLNKEHVADPKTSGTDPSEMRPENKKAKKKGDQSTKRSKIDNFAKTGSSNSKAGPSKSDKKLKDEEKIGQGVKTGSRPETESLDKARDKMGGIGTKLVALASRLTGKFKNDGLSKGDSAGGSRSFSKSKQKTARRTSTPKQEPKSASSNTKGKSRTSGKSKPVTPSKGENSNSKNQPEQTQKSSTASKGSRVESGKGNSGTKRKRQRS